MAAHRIGFQDANFPHRNEWRWSRFEGLSLRWTPYGMPRLSPELSRSVFFLYGKDPQSGELKGPLGTGVFIGAKHFVPVAENQSQQIWSLYAITAAHVALGGASVIRVPTRDGAMREIEFDPCEWIVDLKWEDIAAVDVSDRIIRRSPENSDHDAISFIPEEQFASEAFFPKYEFGIGEDGFMLELFSEHSGGIQDIVAARFGNVSMLADSRFPIERHDPDLDVTFSSPCHVFDIHSRPGFSGSPVFVYRTPGSDLRDMDQHARRHVTPPILRTAETARELRIGYDSQELQRRYEEARNNSFLALLGIHVAQFHDEVQIRKVTEGISEKDATLKTGDTIRFPGSMTIVVPAWQIPKLLENSALKEQRSGRMKTANAARDAKKKGAVVLEKKTPTQVDEKGPNPSHKEDFTSLLSAAATTKPQADRT